MLLSSADVGGARKILAITTTGQQQTTLPEQQRRQLGESIERCSVKTIDRTGMAT